MCPETVETARKVAPGHVVYALLADRQAFAAEKDAPADPDAAFIGFGKA